VPLTTLYVDMNSYFASVEQQFNKDLRGKPVAVVPVDSNSTCCIAASKEAKAFGVKTGTNVGKAKEMCPGLICLKGNFERYVQTHHAIIAAIDTQIPVHEVRSIDEMSARLAINERSTERAVEIARGIKKAIYSRVGEYLTCSIGIAPSRFLAKIASDMQKPDGLIVIQQEDLPHCLYGLKLQDLAGIGPRMEKRLHKKGIMTIEQLCTVDEATLGDAWGSVVGREWYMLLRGYDPKKSENPQRTIGHSHILGPEFRTVERARAVGMRLTNKTAARARHLGYVAEHLSLSVRYRPGTQARDPKADLRWEARLPLGGVNDTPTIVRAFIEMWTKFSRDVGGWSSARPGVVQAAPIQIGVTLTELAPAASAAGLLFGNSQKVTELSKTLDAITKKYGADAVYQASMQSAKRSAPRRIAFNFIPDLEVPDVEA
jgi:DNA polymerase-4